MHDVTPALTHTHKQEIARKKMASKMASNQAHVHMNVVNDILKSGDTEKGLESIGMGRDQYPNEWAEVDRRTSTGTLASTQDDDGEEYTPPSGDDSDDDSDDESDDESDCDDAVEGALGLDEVSVRQKTLEIKRRMAGKHAIRVMGFQIYPSILHKIAQARVEKKFFMHSKGHKIDLDMFGMLQVYHKHTEISETVWNLVVAFLAPRTPVQRRSEGNLAFGCRLSMWEATWSNVLANKALFIDPERSDRVYTCSDGGKSMGYNPISGKCSTVRLPEPLDTALPELDHLDEAGKQNFFSYFPVGENAMRSLITNHALLHDVLLCYHVGLHEDKSHIVEAGEWTRTKHNTLAWLHLACVVYREYMEGVMAHYQPLRGMQRERKIDHGPLRRSDKNQVRVIFNIEEDTKMAFNVDPTFEDHGRFHTTFSYAIKTVVHDTEKYGMHVPFTMEGSSIVWGNDWHFESDHVRDYSVYNPILGNNKYWAGSELHLTLKFGIPRRRLPLHGVHGWHRITHGTCSFEDIDVYETQLVKDIRWRGKTLGEWGFRVTGVEDSTQLYVHEVPLTSKIELVHPNLKQKNAVIVTAEERTKRILEDLNNICNAILANRQGKDDVVGRYDNMIDILPRMMTEDLAIFCTLRAAIYISNAKKERRNVRVIVFEPRRMRGTVHATVHFPRYDYRLYKKEVLTNDLSGFEAEVDVSGFDASKHPHYNANVPELLFRPIPYETEGNHVVETYLEFVARMLDDRVEHEVYDKHDYFNTCRSRDFRILWFPREKCTTQNHWALRHARMKNAVSVRWLPRFSTIGSVDFSKMVCQPTLIRLKHYMLPEGHTTTVMLEDHEFKFEGESGYIDGKKVSCSRFMLLLKRLERKEADQNGKVLGVVPPVSNVVKTVKRFYDRLPYFASNVVLGKPLPEVRVREFACLQEDNDDMELSKKERQQMTQLAVNYFLRKESTQVESMNVVEETDGGRKRKGPSPPGAMRKARKRHVGLERALELSKTMFPSIE